jgi:hypothetical protein
VGDTTGISIFSPELNAKRLQILHEMDPQARRIGIPADTNGDAPARRSSRSNSAGAKAKDGFSPHLGALIPTNGHRKQATIAASVGVRRRELIPARSGSKRWLQGMSLGLQGRFAALPLSFRSRRETGFIPDIAKTVLLTH